MKGPILMYINIVSISIVENFVGSSGVLCSAIARTLISSNSRIGSRPGRLY